MANIPTFEEYVKGLYDYNGDGKLKGREIGAYNRAMNKRNKASTYQLYAQYRAQLEKGTQINAGIEQNNAILAAAIQGNEAAAGVLTGDTKTNMLKYIIFGVIGLVAVFLILKK